jgi:predicted RecA/RadA family phage recombinase
MTDKFVARGDVMNYIAGGTITNGQVVEAKHTLGVALKSGASGDTIPVAVEGVFELPKVSGAVFVVGEKLIWDTSAGAFDDSAATPATGDITGAGVAMRLGANGETTCLVKLTPGNATLT